jgi:hypothetical protein
MNLTPQAKTPFTVRFPIAFAILEETGILR